MIGAGMISQSELKAEQPQKPNIVFVFADEWRAQDIGYAGNKDVLTPHLDKLAKESINFTNTISGCPVCCPYRASLLTGQYPLTNGVFVNDVMLDPEAKTMAKVYKSGGYETAYIGKWHLDGHGRSAFIPKERRQGFDYWKVLECSHNYPNSWYWDNEDKKMKWEGYDAFAQTRDAVSYISDRKKSDKPFLLMLSWGPPHTPLETAPEEYQRLYRDKELKVRSNVPANKIDKTRKDLEGYYGHISALDKCIGDLQQAIKSAGLENNTIFIFTSDHGNMINSHNQYFKQKPYEESIHVPFLLKYPSRFGRKGRTSDMLMNTPDIMPTLLGLSKLPIPETVEGEDLSRIINGEKADDTEAVLISCAHPFGQWSKKHGGREYRGVRTKQYTYVCDLKGPWLMYDNEKDPFQMDNLIDKDDYAIIKEKLHSQLQNLLKETKDDFLPGMDYIKKWGYVVDESGTVPYKDVNFKGIPINK